MYIGSHDVSRYGQGQDVPCGANAGLERALESAARLNAALETLSGKTWLAVRKCRCVLGVNSWAIVDGWEGITMREVVRRHSGDDWSTPLF
jgi:hypothetical protein